MIQLPVRLAVAALILTLAGSAAADTLFVDANLASGADDGSSWANAYQGTLGLQAALTAAVNGDEIFVADGNYLPTGNLSRSVSFALKNGVTIYGSFAGGEAGPDDRPPFGTSDSVLNGDLAGNDGGGSFGDNSFHVISTAGTNATAVIDGFVVRGGAATTSGANRDRGGGILCLGNVSPTVRHCRFLENRSTFGGAAGYVNNNGAPSFTDCTFEDGVGGSFGGAFDIANGGAVRFERCLFRGNTAARGGALEIFATNGVVVNNCLFRDNTSTGTGGGGALWIGSGGNTRVRNSTIVANESTNNAVGGLLTSGAAGVTVKNCILFDNVGPGNVQFSFTQVNTPTDVDYCLVENGFSGGGTGNSGADPAFVDAAGGDYRLTAISAAIDAGNNNDVQAGTTLDYLGLARFVDTASVVDTGVGTAPIVDMGAFEFADDDPWTDLGSALPGTSGDPALVGTGPLSALSPIDIDLTNALGSTTAWLVVGFAELNAAFYGGNMVPDIGGGLAFPLPTSVGGEFSISDTWPSGVPSGFSLYLQYWIEDPGAIFGFAGSNAVRGTTP